MKKLLTLSLILFAFFAKAQKQNSISVSYGFGNGARGYFGKADNGLTHHQKSMNIYGLNYWHALNKHWLFETGLQVLRYDYLTTSFLPNSVETDNTLTIYTVPFKMRFEAGKYIFFNGGLTADLSKGDSADINGLGAGIGIGLQTKIFKQVSIYVNPQANIHGAIPNGFLFAESNLTFGLSYRMK